MPKSLRAMEAKLERLGHRFRVGMARLHPATEKELNVAREALRHQWEKEQRLAQQRTQTKLAGQTQSKPIGQSQPPAEQGRRQQSHDYGHGH